MPSIRDFSGGVLNQELQNRDAGNGVLFDCKNVLSSWNGELRKRTGTRWLKNLSGKAKIIPYRLPNGDDMILLLRNKVINCYIFNSDGDLVPYVVRSGGSSVLFPTSGWTSDTQGDWTVAGTSTYTALSNSAYKAVQTGEYYIYNSQDLDSPGLYFSLENASDVVFGGCTVSWENIAVGIGEYASKCGVDPVIQYSDNGTDWTPIQTTVSEPTVETWTQTGYMGIIEHHTKYSYNVSNDSVIDDHKYWRIVFTNIYNTYPEGYSNSIFPHLMISNISFLTAGTETELVFNNCPYTNDDLDNIKWSQNFRTLTMACKGKIPYQIKISSGVFSDGTFTPSDYVNMWTAIGYPACVTYYQNRLWFGGFESAPTRVYASEFGDFEHFTIPTPVVATSPIMADGTEISNVIENMWGGNNALYCLSEDGISMIDAQGAIVATNQVEFKLRNREPVNSMTPTVKDDIMVYLGRDKRKILITDYDFVVQRFKANCISDNYNDFLQSGIKELHYIPRKSSLIYGVLEDGKMFASLFDVTRNKNSLFPIETNGKVLDLQPIKYGNDTKLLILTFLDSNQYVLEEKLPQADQKIMDFMTVVEKQSYTENVLNSQECYLDHSIKKVFLSQTAVIDGLPYLSGEEIDVIADGQYLGTKTVQFDEDDDTLYIELEEPVNEVILGYKYDSYAVLKFVSPYTMRKFPKEIAVNFINSGYLEVGNTFDSLKSVLNNLVESVSISNKRILMNGNYVKTLDKQAFETPYVIVRSDKGLPFIITGIDYKVDMSNYQGGV